jgi:hypothetical protein
MTSLDSRNQSRILKIDLRMYMKFESNFQEDYNQIMEEDPSVPETDKEFTRDFFHDTHLSTELAILKDGNGPEFARVARRLRDKDALSIGTANDSPMLDTRMYEVEFPNGHK